MRTRGKVIAKQVARTVKGRTCEGAEVLTGESLDLGI